MSHAHALYYRRYNICKAEEAPVNSPQHNSTSYSKYSCTTTTAAAAASVSFLLLLLLPPSLNPERCESNLLLPIFFLNPGAMMKTPSRVAALLGLAVCCLALASPSDATSPPRHGRGMQTTAANGVLEVQQQDKQ